MTYPKYIIISILNNPLSIGVFLENKHHCLFCDTCVTLNEDKKDKRRQTSA